MAFSNASEWQRINGIMHFDIHINKENLHSSAKTLVSHAKKDWDVDRLHHKFFEDGISNKLVGYYINPGGSQSQSPDSDNNNRRSDIVLVRVYGNKTELIIDRARELKNFLLLFKNGLSPVLYCTFENGYCYAYIEGIVLNAEKVRDPKYSEQIARLMAKLHCLPLDKYYLQNQNAEPTLFITLEKYIHTAPEKFTDPKKQLRSSILLCTTWITDKSTCVNFVKAGCLKWRGDFWTRKCNCRCSWQVCPNKEPEKPFCLPKALRPEHDKLQAIDNIVYHPWISKCFTEGKIVDCEEYKVPLILDDAKVEFMALKRSLETADNGIPVKKHHLPMLTLKYENDVPSLQQLSSEVQEMKSILGKHNSPIVFCHNDGLCANFIYNEKEDRVWLIDYEYGSPNYAAYDIGNHFAEYAGVEPVDYSLYPDKEMQMRWLKMYLQEFKRLKGDLSHEVTKEELKMLYIQVNQFALAAHLFWGIWALIQSYYSEIDFDFLGYGIIRLNEYFRRKPEFLALSSMKSEE